MVILLNGMSIVERYTGVVYMARLVARNGHQNNMHCSPSLPGFNFTGLNLIIRLAYMGSTPGSLSWPEPKWPSEMAPLIQPFSVQSPTLHVARNLLRY